MPVKDLHRRRWQPGDRLINRTDKREAMIFKVDPPSATLVLDGGGILIGKQSILEQKGWERIYFSGGVECTDIPSSGT